MRRLGDLIQQIRGVSYKPEDLHDTLNDNSIMLLRANNIQDGQLQFDDVIYVDKSKIKPTQYLKAGDILICASSGSKDLVGKAAYVSTDIHAVFGAFCKIVRPKAENNKYIGHFFDSPSYRRTISALAAGANINNIRNEHIDELRIRIPSFEKQEEISTILDRLKNIISLRKQQLVKLDELVKARFVELFGSLNDNEKGLDIVSIEELCTLIKDGTHQTPTYTEDKQNGFKFLSSKDVMTQKICWDDIKYIPAELHEKLYATIQPQRNDILMSKNGVNYGVAAVNDTDEIFDIYVSLALLRPRTDMVNPVYLRCVINNPDTKRQFDSSIKGIGVPNLHLGEIKKTKVLLPPIDKQNKFVAFVEQTDKSKLAIQKSLDELETLKKSLMQKYFG